MHPVIAEILDWKRGAPVKPVDQERWQDALRDVAAELDRVRTADAAAQTLEVATTSPEKARNP
jgi:hypothetical protein